MRAIILLVTVTFLYSCSAPVSYTWQDTRLPAREKATDDITFCKDYAARQYRPGIPAGEPYLKDQASDEMELYQNKQGEWRPDRSPFPVTNINAQPVHDIPVEYTGYPGELDYSPHYLDDIMEKCMRDRGWEYKPAIEE